MELAWHWGIDTKPNYTSTSEVSCADRKADAANLSTNQHDLMYRGAPHNDALSPGPLLLIHSLQAASTEEPQLLGKPSPSAFP